MATKVIQLYDDIGEYGVSAQGFARVMADAIGSDIELHICCYGGEVSHGFAIANMVKSHVGKKVAIVDGYCASAATFVAMYCDEIHMHEMSMLMMHRSLGGVIGHADDMDDKAKALHGIDSIMAATYKAKSGADDATVAAWMAGDTYLTPAQALAAKLCDKIIPGPSPKGAASAKSPKFYALAGKLPESVRAFLNPPTAAAPKLPALVPVPSTGAIKMKSTAITRGLVVALAGVAHFAALASASADPDEKALGDQLAALDLSAPTAQLAEVKDAPELGDLFELRAKVVQMVGCEEGLIGGLEAFEANASRKGAAAGADKMAQVNALLAAAVDPQPDPVTKVRPPRKLTPAQAAAQRLAYVKNPAKPLADLSVFIRLSQPLAELNQTEDTGAGSGNAEDDTQVDAEYLQHANGGKVLAGGGK